MRPPTRSRASRTITDLPSPARLRAAVSPARPAPTTTKSTFGAPATLRGFFFFFLCLCFRCLRASAGVAAIATPAATLAPRNPRRVLSLLLILPPDPSRFLAVRRALGRTTSLRRHARRRTRARAGAGRRRRQAAGGRGPRSRNRGQCEPAHGRARAGD